MKTAFLQSFPLPKQGPLLGELSRAVENFDSPQDIEELVRLAYGLSKEEWQFIV